jgi:hypothetical protein
VQGVLVPLLLVCLSFRAASEKTRSKYVRIGSDGEPTHVHVEHHCPFTTCLHRGRKTADCSCVCKGHWNGDSCQKCGLKAGDCRNGGFLDEETCSCVGCRYPWGGKLCSDCNADSSKFDCELDQEVCRCKECPAPWGGPNCNTCLLDATFCGGGSKLNKELCECEKCSENDQVKRSATKPVSDKGILSWADAFGFLELGKKPAKRLSCHTCPIQECSNGGRLNKEKCVCEKCGDNWGGLRCKKCLLEQSDCQHGAQLDESSCTCSINCKSPWGGALCSECRRGEDSCWNGGKLNQDLCRCEQCEAPWGGNICGDCEISKYHCKHGGVPCKSSCRCVQCEDPWTGPSCAECGLTDEDCDNGGKLDSQLCQCQCAIPWTGKRCTSCGLAKESCAKGTVLDVGKCSCVPKTTSPGREAAQKVAAADLALATVLKSKLTKGASLIETGFQPAEVDAPKRANIGKLISCSWTGVPDKMTSFVGQGLYYGRSRDHYFQHLFVGSECTGGKLPDPREGDWMSMLPKRYACGKAEQWSVMSPNEEDGPGVIFSNLNPCSNNNVISIRADFFLPNKEHSKHFHRCVWQGTPERLMVGELGKQDALDAKSVPLPSWWTATSEEKIAVRKAPGKVDGDSAGMLKRFRDPINSKPAGAEADDKESPGYFQHVFDNTDCTNGLPPTNRPCMVSMRWGESCGSDSDWKAVHRDGRGDRQAAAAVEWYTRLKCDSSRVAVDYFCPEKSKAFDVALDVHSCRYEGGRTATACPGVTRHANDEAAGSCFKHDFKADQCRGNLPGAGDNFLDKKRCMAAVREFSKCGDGEDFDVSFEKPSVSWASSTVPGDTNKCSSEGIVVDYLCLGECRRVCAHGSLDRHVCSCNCDAGFTGLNCDICGIEETDCKHGSVLNAEKCKCVKPAGSDWGGAFGSVCDLSQGACKNGGVLDKKLCKCGKCNEFWSGKLCNVCTRTPDMCKNGASLDPETCTCSVNCPTWGPLCERCPKNAAGMECSGRGQCREGTCLCLKGFSGKSCDVKQDAHVCKVSDYADIAAFNKGLESSIVMPGEYILSARKLSNGDTISINVEVGSLQGSKKRMLGVKAVAIKYTSRKRQDALESISLFSPKDFGAPASYGENCGTVQSFKQRGLLKSSRGNLALRRHGKNTYIVSSKNQARINIVMRGNGRISFMDVAINMMSSKEEKMKGLCGSPFQNPKIGFGGKSFLGSFVKDKETSLLKCYGGSAHRFAELSSGKSRGASGLRFREAKSNTEFANWGNADWGEPTVPVVAKPTSMNLLPAKCDAVSAIVVEKQCKKFLPAGDVSSMERGATQLSPYKACSKVMCKVNDVDEAFTAAEQEVKNNNEASREEEVARLDDAMFAVENEAASKAKKAYEDFASNGKVCPELRS